jgi:dipeptidyl aminopeptidase/acylaminoacyl peptidase
MSNKKNNRDYFMRTLVKLKPSKIWVGTLFLLLFASLANAQNESHKRLLKVDDLFRIKGVATPKMSPDGKWIAYTVTETSLKDDKSETRIWMKPVDGGEAIPMTMKGTSSDNPQWSPDGKYLSFSAARNDGKKQVWVLNRNGGEGQQLTHVAQGIEDYAWSPDGQRLALIIKEKAADEKEDSTEKDKKKPVVITRLQFKRDYIGYLDTLHTHVYVYDINQDSLRQVTSGEYDDSDPVWSPDGNRIAFVSNRTEMPDRNSNTDIWVVDASNTNKGANPTKVTTNPGPDNSPSWSPDGSKLAYVTSREPELLWYDVRELATVSAEGGPATILTEQLDRNVSSPHFSKDGNSIYFGLEDSGEQQLARIGLNGRNLERVISGELSLWSYDLGPGNAIAALITKTQLPEEVFTYRDGKLNQFTYTNQAIMDSLNLAEVRNIHFESKDGTPIEGFMTLPVGYEQGKKYPTLLRIHGGPVAQFSYYFNFNAQLFAANGYVVINVNPRGSSGYGQAFSKAIWADWGNKDYEDVMAGVDYAINQGIADPEQLGVGGWSYGGILTDHVITRTNRFKAAISGASEVLYTSNYGHDHYQLQWEKELGLPWKHQAKWDRISPFWDVEKIATPTLLMGGSEDWNVPLINSEQLYQALKRIGKVDTELIVYPGQHHGFTLPSFRKDVLERYLDWYDKYVKK